MGQRLRTLLRGLSCLATLCLAGFTASAAHAQRVDEASLKATFLVRFGAFVEWPPSAFAAPDSPLSVCVAGDSALATYAERAASVERFSGRRVSVRRVEAGGEAAGCHVLYAGGARQSVAESLRNVKNQPVLTITDARYGDARGIIHFVISGDRVRFHVDRAEARAKGLQLSSRLLNVALTVQADHGWGPA
jgi:hypothetical protein